jgi:hypothetical protein
MLDSPLPDILHAASRIAVIGTHVWFVVVPVMLYPLFAYLWLYYVIVKYESGLKPLLLEIIPPKDIEKSPQLMEGLFDGISGSGKGYTTFETWVLGESNPRFSFEIAGGDGHAHFYIRTAMIMRNLVEAHLYAQYPTVEIVEVPDYVNDVPRNIPNKDYNLWGSDLKLKKADAYPIKTYHYFEESVTGTMMDPLAGLIEVIAKLPPGQHIWLQFVIKAGDPTFADKDGKKLIDEIVNGKKPKSKSMWGMLAERWTGGATEEKSDSKKDIPVEFKLTPVQRKVLEAVENNLGKHVFSVKMRFMYFGRRETYSKGAFLAAIQGAILRPYSDSNLNSIVIHAGTKTSVEYVFMGSRLRYLQRRLFRRYRDRDRDPDESQFILSSSELATLFHLPDGSVVSPALTRVSAKRGGSPSNLPVE